MSRTIHCILLLIIPCLFLMLACNPTCDTTAASNISIEPAAVLPGSQVKIRSVPANYVKDRKVFIDESASSSRKKEIPTYFSEEHGALVAQVPNDALGSVPLYLEDPDCSGSFIYINPLQIENEGFFAANDLFIVPPIPIIIIPTPVVNLNINVTNAWITPYQRSYCIWFVPELDDDGNEKSELRPLLPDDQEQFGMKGSHEFVVCGEAQRHANANVNPVSGFIDKKNGIIRIQIDRTTKGLGVEHFSGTFIKSDNLPPEYLSGGICEGNLKESPDFMLLTSSKTGQQLLLVQITP